MILWKLLIVIVILYPYESVGSEKRVSGTLWIKTDFKNPDEILDNSARCDVYDSGCDTRQTLSIIINGRETKKVETAEGPIEWKFDLYFYQEDHHSSEFNEISINLLGEDIDFLKNDLIGVFNITLTPETIDKERIPMGTRKYYKPDSINADLLGFQIKCRENYYGFACERHCDNGHPNYHCDEKGFKICEKDYTGDHCDLFDVCGEQSCLKGAECKSIEGRQRICLCDGGKNEKKCYPDYDHCLGVNCENGSICQVDSSFNAICECPAGYWGKLCEIPSDKCYTTKTFNETIIERYKEKGVIEKCFNGGRCSMDLKDEFEPYKCTCEGFWTGKQCEEPLTFRRSVYISFVVLMVLSLLICLIVIGIKFFIKKKNEKDFKLNYKLGEDSDYLFIDKD